MTQTKTATIVELDLVGYSDKARELEEGFSVKLVAKLDDQIQGFVDAGLKTVKIPRSRAVFGKAGDNALVLFRRAEQAHRFVRAVHLAAGQHNARTTLPSAQRWFRSGAATGEVCFRREGREQTVSGFTITRAVRLEAAARPGELLVDPATFAALPPDLQHPYGPEEPIPGKRGEQFPARRCVMLPGAPPCSTRAPKTSPRAAARPRSRRGQPPASNAINIRVHKLTRGHVTGVQRAKGIINNTIS